MPEPSAGADAEDAKLVTLARAARARIGAIEGAAVRDQDGRTYAAATVDLPSLRLSALQLAVASAGRRRRAARWRRPRWSPRRPLWTIAGYAAVRDLSPTAPVHAADPGRHARWAPGDGPA